MSARTKAEAKAELERRLFLDADDLAYVIIDGAQVPGLPAALLEREADHACLFSGDLAPEVEAVAPQLVALAEDGDDFDWAFDHFVESNALVFVRSPWKMTDLRRHLRKLALAEMPDGQVVFFRYYDPRTLLQVLPIATVEQGPKLYGRSGEVLYLLVDKDLAVHEFSATP